MQLLRERIAKLSSKSSKKSDSSSDTHVVPLGRLVNTHGVRGELRFLPYAFPCSTLQKDLTISLTEKEGSVRFLTVESVRPHAPFLLVRLQGIVSPEQARELCDSIVSVEEHVLPPLQEGEFYYYQVIGLDVVTVTGESIGSIAHVFFAGGHDVWVVRNGKTEHMIPVTDEIVRSIDLAERRAVIQPLPGLLE
jgi:16S rRNA processing protein RimM